MKFNLIISMVLVVSLIGCTKQVAENKVETKAETKMETTVATTQPQTQAQTAPAQLTGDPLKDELSWPIGKFGYHEPPESIRHYDEDEPERYYQIYLHSDIYGDLTMDYDTVGGQRTLFPKGQEDATHQLMIVGKNNTSTNAELLEDLQMGDSIARNFGK